MKKQPLEWGRPRYDRIETAKRRVTVSTCKRFRVERLKSIYGLHDRVLLLQETGLDICPYRVVSYHRTEAAAKKAAEAIHRQRDKTPKVRTKRIRRAA